jgi:hypothetical protein
MKGEEQRLLRKRRMGKMRGLLRKATLVVLVLALVATFSFGCGQKGGGGKVRVTIGLLTDMTGPASSLLRPGNNGTQFNIWPCMNGKPTRKIW